MWNSTIETGRAAGPEQKKGPVYVFKECDRKIQEAVDNKQVERKMTVYGQESDASKNGNNGKAGNGED